MSDIFIWAYERSAAHYGVVKQSIGEPDPFRLKYHFEMIDIISQIIIQKITNSQVEPFITKWMHEKIPSEDKKHFLKVINEELKSLHEGNIARFRILPSEFDAWKNRSLS